MLTHKVSYFKFNIHTGLFFYFHFNNFLFEIRFFTQLSHQNTPSKSYIKNYPEVVAFP